MTKFWFPAQGSYNYRKGTSSSSQEKPGTHPTIHKIAPHNEELSDTKCGGVQVEKTQGRVQGIIYVQFSYNNIVAKDSKVTLNY